MSKFIVQGGSALAGSISVGGSKNAALAVLSATILAADECVVENVPDILDVRNFLKILEHLGAKVRFEDHVVLVDTRNMQSRQVPPELASALRGSVLTAGPLLGRFGEAVIVKPGGDAIGHRPMDVHLEGFRKLGASVTEGQTIKLQGQLTGATLVLPVPSVTGTENLIMAAVMAKGQTEIKTAAAEPHVQDLCNFLTAMGAKIDGIGTPTLRIAGSAPLHGARWRLCSDEIETVTLCAAAAATGGTLTITNVDLVHLDAPLAAMERMKIKFTAQNSTIQIHKPQELYLATNIVTGVYPQLLTDEQPLFGVLATLAVGETSIHDWIYEGRQGYLLALKKMGANVILEDKNHARISGPTKLNGAEIMTPDLRAGASILIAALVARGQSIIYNAEIIDRGYERLDERLRTLGANILRAD